MFCYIHEGGELKKGANETVQYISGHTIYIEIDDVFHIMNLDQEFVRY